MKHCIIVKFTDEAKKDPTLTGRIEALFARASDTEGVNGVNIIPNCVDRPNRYDALIAIDMDRDALPAWDASPVHAEWKRGFGSLLASKAIFDCETFEQP